MVNSTVYWIVLASLYNCFIKKHEKLSYLSLRLTETTVKIQTSKTTLSPLSLSLFNLFLIYNTAQFLIYNTAQFNFLPKLYEM